MAVATREAPAGHVVGDDNLRWEERPADLVTDPVTDGPTGRVVIHPVLAGEVLAADRLTPDRLVGPGRTAAVGVPCRHGPLAARLPPLEVGDTVDLVSAGGGTTFGAADFPDLPELDAGASVPRRSTRRAAARRGRRRPCGRRRRRPRAPSPSTSRRLVDTAAALASGWIVVALAGPES
ncbi:MAG: SAF domain-containing protein [Acidimicrobiia bacterium]|nr:SAF domain-containing protein [Acidimicrobiia bacterium]